MPRESLPPEANHLVAEVATEIVGRRYFDAALAPGEPVHLVREPGNPYDPWAVLVENRLGEPAGHLRREVAAWLAPGVDAGTLRLAGRLPRSFEADDFAAPLYLRIYGPRGHDLGVPPEGVRPRPPRAGAPRRRVPGPRARPVEGTPGGLAPLLARFILGPPAHHRNLTLIPLLPSGEGPGRAPGLLSEALADGRARVEEVNEGGSVASLAVVNLGAEPILVPEGEILVGAKQNRVVNLTVLVAPGSRFVLPVSCVERGRWRYLSRHFAAGAWASPRVRRRKHAALFAEKAGAGVSAQGEVWAAVDEDLEAHSITSPTSSFVDGFEAARRRNGAYRRRLPLPAGACGVIAGKGEQVLGVALFAAPESLAALWERLSAAYFAEAAVEEGTAPPTPPEKASEFLAAVAASARHDSTRPGLGEGFEVSSPALAGSGLLWEGTLCHLAAFSL